MLRLEIVGLEEVLRQIFLEINSLKTMQERQKWSLTLQGKYFNVLGYFFSGYCLWKIFIVSLNIRSNITIVFLRTALRVTILCRPYHRHIFHNLYLIVLNSSKALNKSLSSAMAKQSDFSRKSSKLCFSSAANTSVLVLLFIKKCYNHSEH